MRLPVHFSIALLLAAIVAPPLAAQSLQGTATYEPLIGHTGIIHSLAYTPDGRTLVSAGADRKLRFWRLHEDHVDDLEKARREQLLIDVNHPRFAIRQKAFEQLAELGVLMKPALLEQLQSPLSPEAVLRTRRLVAMADIPQGIGHRREVRGVAVSPDGKTVASAGRDNLIGIWDIAIGRPITVIGGHSDGVWSVGFSTDGRHLASGGGDDRLRIWDVETQVMIQEWKGHESTIHDMEFSPDGTFLASAGGFDQTVRIWNLTSDRCVHVLSQHNDAVMCLAISPDSKSVASGGYDGRVYLWDAQHGTLMRSLAAHDGIIRGMAFSPRDASQLVSVGDDRLAIRWDCETGRKLETYQRHRSGLRAVAFAPDGGSLATADRYGVIHRWALDEPSVSKSP